MAILDFGTSPSTIQEGAITTTHYTGSAIDPNVQEGCRIQGTNTGVIGNFLKFTAQTDIWVSGSHYTSDSTWDNKTMFMAGQEDGAANYMRIVSTSSENFRVDINIGGSWSNQGTISHVASTRRRWDIHIVTGVSGEVTIYEGATTLFTWTGDFSGLSIPLERVSFGQAGASGSEEMYWSAMFVADEDSRPITMVQHTIDAAGSNNGLVGGDYDSVNDIGSVDDATKLVTDGAGSKSSFVISDVPLGFSVGYEVVGVGVKLRGAKGGAASSDLKAIAVDGANESESADMGLTTTLGAKGAQIPTAPDGTAWTASKINSAEIGIKAT